MGVVEEWLERVGVKTLFIEPSNPRENGTVESQRQSWRRVAERRDLLHARGSPGHYRVLASGVQHVPAAQLAGLSPTGTRDGLSVGRQALRGYRPSQASRAAGRIKLVLDPIAAPMIASRA